MAQKSTAAERLTKIKDFLTMTKTAGSIPWDPDSTKFPTRHELPTIPGAPAQAAWVWGTDDNLGRINLLTPSRVAAAAKEVRSGEIVPVNLPLTVPEQPAFGREKFEHRIKTLAKGISYDDIYHMNTQSGTQWDGFRHFSHIATSTFYNNCKDEDIEGDKANQHKCSMHHWSNHGIAGRGVLIDYRSYAERHGKLYDAYSTYSISYPELVACGKEQGIDIRPEAQGGDIKVGDILFIRSGWVQAYYARTPEERTKLALREHGLGPDDGQRYAGVEQSEDMLDWLHDCYFAAVAGDAPAFESWPTKQSK